MFQWKFVSFKLGNLGRLLLGDLQYHTFGLQTLFVGHLSQAGDITEESPKHSCHRWLDTAKAPDQTLGNASHLQPLFFFIASLSSDKKLHQHAA